MGALKENTNHSEPAALSDETVDALMTAIKHRRSMGVARLLPDPVEPTLIQQALEAADWAPSHGDTEPWRFVVYTGQARNALGDAFAEAYRHDAERDGGFKQTTFDAQRERSQSAPVWISIGMQPAIIGDGSPKMSIEEELMAVACAVQNLHLVASAQGLAGMWLSKGVFRHERVAQFVGLEPPYGRLLGFFVLGKPSIPWPAGERRPHHEKVQWAEGSDPV